MPPFFKYMEYTQPGKDDILVSSNNTEKERTSMKMKKVMGLFLVAVMVAGLTACGGGNDKAAQADGGGKEEADSGKKTITFCFRDDGQGEDGALWKWIQDGYDTWDKKDTVELNIAPIVAQEGDYFTKVLSSLRIKKHARTWFVRIPSSFQMM